ncbi:hypothetical protein R5R35_012706 [Gryllus longicercus]|uniref:F-box domain-containing protein n=1 Tax=Gryllus longicercus TaxID=2509291 RepID=A0AAN9WBB1_9ORTH
MQDESEGQNAFWTERNILSLSDEVLVNICTYLTSEAAVSLSCTCKRFNDLLCERKLIRCINLRASYSVSLDVDTLPAKLLRIWRLGFVNRAFDVL